MYKVSGTFVSWLIWTKLIIKNKYLLGSSGRLLPNSHNRLSPNHFSMQDATLFHSLNVNNKYTTLFIRVSERECQHFPPIILFLLLWLFEYFIIDVVVAKAGVLLLKVWYKIDRGFVYGFCRPVYMTTAAVGQCFHWLLNSLTKLIKNSHHNHRNL